MSTRKQKFFLVFSILFLFLPHYAFAEEAEKPTLNLDRLQNFGDQGVGFFLPADIKDNPQVAQSAALFVTAPVILLIQILYGFLATILVLLILRGGYIWLTSGGNEEKTKKALDTIRQAVIGFAILLGSAIIIYFVLLILGQVNVGIIGSDATLLQ